MTSEDEYSEKLAEAFLESLNAEFSEEDARAYEAVSIVPSRKDRRKTIEDLVKKFDDSTWMKLAKKHPMLWKLANLIKADSDMADKIAVSAAIFILSVATRRSQHIDIAQAKIRLNLYMMVIGYSGRSRKTTTRGFIERIIDMLDIETLASKLTPQALFRDLSQTPDAVILRDEVSGMFKNMRKEYMEEMPELMSDIYDSKDKVVYSTIARGKQVMREPYLRFYAGTTPTVVKVLEDTYFEQGFIPRFNIVFDDDLKRKTKKLGFHASIFEKNINDLVEELDMMKKSPINKILAREKPEEFEAYEEYCNEESLRHLEDGDLLMSAYYERLPVHTLKLAALFMLADVAQQGYHQSTIPLDEDYIILACKFGRLFEQEYLRLVYRYRSSSPSQPFKSDEKRLVKVLDTIRQKGDWITSSELIRRTKISKRLFDETIETLKASEYISEAYLSKDRLRELGIIGPGDLLRVRGRPPIVIYLRDKLTDIEAIITACLDLGIIDPTKKAFKGFYERYKYKVAPELSAKMLQALTEK